MIRKVLAGALCALALATSAAAEEAPANPETPVPAESTPPAKPAQPVADPNEVVCKDEVVIGRRIPKRTCTTRAQREARAKAGRETLEGQQRNNGGAPENLGGG